MTNPKDAPEELFKLQDRVNELTRAYVKNLSESNDALTEHAHFMQTILDSAGPGIFVVDKEGKVLLVNKAASRIAGVDPSKSFEQQINEKYTVLTASGEPLEEERGLIMKAMRERKLIEEELQVLGDGLPDGKLWVKIHATPVLGNDDELLGGVNVFLDITERKKAYERISNLYNQAPCGYMSLDKQGTIIDVNDTFLEWMKDTRTQVEGSLKFSKLVAEDSKTKFKNSFKQLKAGKEPIQTELELKNNSGEIGQFMWTSRAIMSNKGKFLASRCTITDITHKVETENQRDALAALVTHDIKNHMSAESILVDHFLTNNVDSLSEEDIELLKSLKKSNNQFLTIVTNLLQMYRLERGSFKLSFEQVKLEELVQASITSNESIASMKAVTINLDAKSEASVKCDRSSISHVIHNLLNNAISLSPENSCVNVVIRESQKGALIEVADSGGGISEEEEKLLFEPLWRWNSSSATISRLGLHLCKVFIDAHGGKISVEKNQTGGSTFTILIPNVPQS